MNWIQRIAKRIFPPARVQVTWRDAIPLMAFLVC